MKIDWHLKKFSDLTPFELYAIIQLRNEVFVVEQECAFQDADGKDYDSLHFMGFADEKLVAYTRLLPPGLMYEQPSIGRVVTSPAVRGSGAGKDLMRRSIAIVKEQFGQMEIKIGAQLYLKKFYESLGFEQCSEVYIEDGIDHIYMIKRAES